MDVDVEVLVCRCGHVGVLVCGCGHVGVLMCGCGLFIDLRISQQKLLFVKKVIIHIAYTPLRSCSQKTLRSTAARCGPSSGP